MAIISKKDSKRQTTRKTNPPLYVVDGCNIFEPTILEPFNLIEELNCNRDLYLAGDKYSRLTLLGFPYICDDNLDRMRARVLGSCGKAPAISACIHNGLECLKEDDRVDKLCALKKRFNLTPSTLDGHVNRTINSFFKDLEIDLPSGITRQGVNVPSEIGNKLSGLSDELGVKSKHQLATIAVMVTLTQQEDTNQDDIEKMRECIETFHKRVEVRGRAAQALMKEFEV